MWVSCIGVAFSRLERYGATPGKSGSLAPQGTHFLEAHRQRDRPLLVMAVHPRCPCSDASLGELGDLLARARGACDALLLEYRPEEGGAGWGTEDPPARELGGVRVKVLADPDGRLAASLGAVTSGHVVLADAQGRLRFQGGLTPSRGHRGRTPGQDAILEMIAGGSPTLVASRVFGCSLETCRAEISP